MEAVKKVNNYNCNIKKIWLRPGEKIHELMINDTEWHRIIDYKNRYIIWSLIQNYKNIENKPDYITSWKEITMGEYSSAWSLISTEELIEKYWEYLLIK